MIQSGIFAQIKDRVSTREAAELYGFEVNRHGMMCCPFHPDKAPSMKVDRNYICFGCQEKGDVISFVSKVFGLKPYEAARKLAADFGLSIIEDRKAQASSEQLSIKKQLLADQRRFKQIVDRIEDAFCKYHRMILRWIQDTGPISADDELSRYMIAALQLRDAVEDILDVLLYGTIEEKAEIVIETGKKVKHLEERIRKTESGNNDRASFCNGSSAT